MLWNLVWIYATGGFSCKRTNLLGLHQLYGRTLWVPQGAVGAYSWPGIIVLDLSWLLMCPTEKWICFLLTSFSSDFVFLNLLIVSVFCYWNRLVMLQRLYDTSLLLVCMQIIVILTKSVNRCFEKNPKFDMTPLLGGTELLFSSLVHSFSWFVSLLWAHFFLLVLEMLKHLYCIR